MKTRNFNLLGNTILINFEEATNNGKDYIKTDRFRSPGIRASLGNFDSMTLLSETVSDIQFQINVINSLRRWDAKISLFALRESCENHIVKYGRLILTDLYTYVDCSLHIISSIEKDATLNDFHDIYENYVNQAIQWFKNDIYIMKPWGLSRI